MCGAAVESGLLALAVDLETEPGRDDDLVPDLCKCFTYEFFVGVWTVHFGSIEERYAALAADQMSPIADCDVSGGATLRAEVLRDWLGESARGYALH